jgi:hypothetical protein
VVRHDANPEPVHSPSIQRLDQSSITQQTSSDWGDHAPGKYEERRLSSGRGLAGCPRLLILP